MGMAKCRMESEKCKVPGKDDLGCPLAWGLSTLSMGLEAAWFGQVMEGYGMMRCVERRCAARIFGRGGSGGGVARNVNFTKRTQLNKIINILLIIYYVIFYG